MLQKVGALLFTHSAPLLRTDLLFCTPGCGKPFASLLFEPFHELLYRSCFVQIAVVPRIKELQEDPLGPAIEGGIGGLYLTRPVERKAQGIELFSVARHILPGRICRMPPGLDGILLSGKTEGIVAHGMQHHETAVPLVARDDVRGDIAQRMSHMEPGARGIRKHVQYIEFWLITGFRSLEQLLLCPHFLPFAFEL